MNITYFLFITRAFYDGTETIKVISEVRRCGKSCLMKTIIAEMVDRKIPKENIIYIDLRKRSFRNVKTQEALENKIDEMSKSKGLKYLFYNCIYSFGYFSSYFHSKINKTTKFLYILSTLYILFQNTETNRRPDGGDT